MAPKGAQCPELAVSISKSPPLKIPQESATIKLSPNLVGGQEAFTGGKSSKMSAIEFLFGVKCPQGYVDKIQPQPSTFTYQLIQIKTKIQNGDIAIGQSSVRCQG